MWAAKPPLCGKIFCGTYPEISTLGWGEKETITLAALAETFLVSPELSGTLPEPSQLGYSTHGTIRCMGTKAEAFIVETEESGTKKTGTIPQTAVVGQSVNVELHTGKETAVKVYVGVPSTSGVAYCGTMP